MSAVNYIVYDATGRIKRTGQCPANMVAKQRGPNDFVMKGTANDAEDRVSDDRKSIVKLTHAEKEARKPIRMAKTETPDSPMGKVYKILERLEKQGYDLGTEWDELRRRPT